MNDFTKSKRCIGRFSDLIGCVFNVFGHFLKMGKLSVYRGKKGSKWLEKGGKRSSRLEGTLMEV